MPKKNNSEFKILHNPKDNMSIIPIFLPFWACPQICVFCNQSLQTGHKSSAIVSKNQLLVILEEAKAKCLEYKSYNRKVELAFYGGTFSALPEEEFSYSLDFLEQLKAENLVDKARCSTRPDALDNLRLLRMKESGIETIELGIQSFSDSALTLSNRGYSSAIALSACTKVKEFGFKLGIQLMPNLPAQTHEEFLTDIDITLSIVPDFIRLYPCLVVEGTKLANMYKEGIHKEWHFEETIELLAIALFKSWQANISVIRIGVAPEDEFYEKVIAGVHHKSLGQIVQARALQLCFDEMLNANAITKPENYIFEVPMHAKGFLMISKDSFWKDKKISTQNILFYNGNEIKYREK